MYYECQILFCSKYLKMEGCLLKQVLSPNNFFFNYLHGNVEISSWHPEVKENLLKQQRRKLDFYIQVDTWFIVSSTKCLQDDGV